MNQDTTNNFGSLNDSVVDLDVTAYANDRQPYNVPWPRSSSEPSLYGSSQDAHRSAWIMELAHPLELHEQAIQDNLASYLSHMGALTLITQHSSPLINSSWGNACNPMATMHDTSPWETIPCTISPPATHYHSSPEMSRTEFGPPMWTSPPRFSAMDRQAAGVSASYRSPMIKTEEPDALFDDRILPTTMDPVNPGILAASSNVNLPTHAPRVKKEAIEEEIRKPRPSRMKRGFTTDLNAKCRCNICGRPFQRTYNLKQHLNIHDLHRSKPFVCQYEHCEHRFVRKTDLNRHVDTVSTLYIHE